MKTVERIIITEDYALQCNVSIESLILEKEKQGFREVNRYTHPAVGLVVALTNASVPDDSIAPYIRIFSSYIY